MAKAVVLGSLMVGESDALGVSPEGFSSDRSPRAACSLCCEVSLDGDVVISGVALGFASDGSTDDGALLVGLL